ncbi:winged helix-turn-helix transcriptional regulator (plasmid) [Halorussus salilacus]|uniref:winged helix-turn-helix transcriptional regulator n=1 Tax=Halorussus salilacus TaxID=2953750 RepID=UPI00209D05C3|nr:winged helix-turn-helix transcriptional regulator [Halorussus salilacus]USZ69818.1 winged helix-turn-helix transcriptional regulator [Halorussus salilacus]
MSETRRDIADHVRANPGVHFNAVVRGLDLAPGQVQYHLRRLRSEGEVVAEELRGRTHLYPPGYDEWERSALATFRRENARDALAHLLDAGETTPAELADELGVARSTVEWHLDSLVAEDLVDKRREGNRVFLELTRPEATAELLAEITPSLPERLVDRFTRLVDGFLEEG